MGGNADTIIINESQESQLDADSTGLKSGEVDLSQTTSLNDTAKGNKAALAKEEEEFLKLESIFITELGLSKDQMPNFLK